MAVSSTAGMDYMRIEVATLVDRVELKKAEKGKFKISTLMTGNSIGGSSLHTDNMIELNIPFSIKMFFQADKFIEAGTKFLVTFIGADYNNPRIIALSTQELISEFEYNHYEVEDNLDHIKEILEVYNDNWAWNAIRRIDGEIANLYAVKADRGHSH